MTMTAETKRRRDAVLADHIASEAVRRILKGEALGRPSLHNIIRETVIDALDPKEGS